MTLSRRTFSNRQNLSGHALVIGLLEGDVSLVGSLGLVGDRLLLGSGQNASATLHLGVRVEADHDTKVLEGVLLLAVVHASNSLGRVEDLLDFIGVDNSREIAVSHDVTRKLVTVLGSGSTSGGSKDGVGAVEGSLSPNDEATKVTTGGKLKKVETIDVGEIDTRQVAKGLDDTVVVGVDNERTTALDMASVSGFTRTGADGPRLLGLLDIIVGTELLENGDSFLGLLDRLDG